MHRLARHQELRSCLVLSRGGSYKVTTVWNLLGIKAKAELPIFIYLEIFYQTTVLILFRTEILRQEDYQTANEVVRRSPLLFFS